MMEKTSNKYDNHCLEFHLVYDREIKSRPTVDYAYLLVTL